MCYPRWGLASRPHWTAVIRAHLITLTVRRILPPVINHPRCIVTLQDLSVTDDEGRTWFALNENDRGEFVVGRVGEQAPPGAHPLPGERRRRLAERPVQRAGLVVESTDGQYVVLVDHDPDPERHLPLGLDDAEALVITPPAAVRFGGRPTDVLPLSAWAAEDEAVTFDPDKEEFVDVPLVALAGSGTLAVHRGEVPDRLRHRVARHLKEVGAEIDEPHGLIANAFDEFVAVSVGQQLSPHEDLRRQTLLRSSALLDGSRTLSEAALRLRDFADMIERAETGGWQLVVPWSRDIGLPERIPQ